MGYIGDRDAFPKIFNCKLSQDILFSFFFLNATFLNKKVFLISHYLKEAI